MKTEQTPSMNMEDSILIQFVRSTTKLMIQQSTNNGVGGSSSLSSKETLKTEPTSSMNIKEDVLTIDSITVDELMKADLSSIT